MTKSKETLIDKNWEQLFAKYPIETEIAANGCFYITAAQIKEFKEARLMTKFDTLESLPKVFGDKYSILPVTRGTYVIGDFDLYQDIPEKSVGIQQISALSIPDYYETIDIENIRSEAAAIHMMSISGILDDFLGEEGMTMTVSGRMGSGDFAFSVNNRKKTRSHRIKVSGAQVEIDGGFENPHIFAILEGKNVVHSNFLVRQLYYPYRLWRARIQKPIRTVFMVYSNNIFRLLEYEFQDPECYSSIRLVQERRYSLEDTAISMEDIADVYAGSSVKPEPEHVAFPQADSFEKVISLLEHVREAPRTSLEIAELLGFRERQSSYYSSASEYLGLTERRRENGRNLTFLTGEGKKLLENVYKKRQLEYVRRILEHQLFREGFEIRMRTGEFPDKRWIEQRMLQLELCSQKVAGRRSSTVIGWLRWIQSLTEK